MKIDPIGLFEFAFLEPFHREFQIRHLRSHLNNSVFARRAHLWVHL